MKRYFEGIKFGLLLQFAIGPLCLMVFNTAKNSGFFVAFTLVLVIASVDAFYITISCLGASKFLKNKKTMKTFRTVGSIILVLLGLNILLSSFGIKLIPGFNLHPSSKSILLQGLIIALSNPLTIIFWGTVLTAKVIEENFKKRELIIFCFGLVSSTLLFLTTVAFVGSLISKFIPDIVANIMNICVGLLIMFFGAELYFKPDKVK